MVSASAKLYCLVAIHDVPRTVASEFVGEMKLIKVSKKFRKLGKHSQHIRRLKLRLT